MNTQSINRMISKELGLKKSETIKSYTRDNSSNISYAYRRVYRYSGDFHCAKEYQNTFTVHLDNLTGKESCEKIIELLKLNGCKNIRTSYDKTIWFEI